MLVRAESLFVLQHGFGGVAVIDLGEQPPPRSNHRLEHHRVAQLLDGRQGGLRGKGRLDAWLGHVGLGQRRRRDQLVAAGGSHMGHVHGGHAPGVEDLGGVQAARKRNAAFEDNVQLRPGAGLSQFKVRFPVVDAFIIDAALLQRFEQPLFFNPDAG